VGIRSKGACLGVGLWVGLFGSSCPGLAMPVAYTANNGAGGVQIMDMGTNAVTWSAPISFSLKFTFLSTNDSGNTSFQTLSQTFTGTINYVENGLVPSEITFVSDDGTTEGDFTNLASIMTDTSGRSDSLLLVGTGTFSSSSTGTTVTGIAYINAKGTLQKDSSGAVTSISLNGTIAGGIDQTTVFSTTFRVTLSPAQ